MRVQSKYKVPGPRGLQLAKALRKMQENPIAAFEHDIKKFGDVVFYNFPLRAFTIIANPKHIHHILNSNAQNYDKDTYSYRQLKKFVGNGLLTANNSQWSKYRSTLQMSLSAGNIHGKKPIIKKVIKKWINTHPQSRKVDIGFEMTALSLEILMQSLLGYNLTKHRLEEIVTAITTVLTHTNHRISYPLHPKHWLPISDNRIYKASLNILNQEVSTVLNHYEQEQNSNNLLLDSLKELEASKKDLKDQIMTLLLAGHETSARVLTWFFYLAALNPNIQDDIRTEASQKPVSAPDKTHSTILSAIMETMRLFPPVWLFERRALNDDIISGHKIPGNSTVALFTYHIHRRSDLWDTPDKFLPQRFSDIEGSKRLRYSYLPFGGGARHCIGNHFAMLELQLVIKELLKSFHFSLCENKQVSICAGLTLRPKNPIYLNITPR